MTKRALIQRINRKLATDGEVLKATRGERGRQAFGDFYVIDASQNAVMSKHVDPERLGRELGVLKPYETLVD